MQNPLLSQISNRNPFIPIGFKFNLTRNPKVDFFSTSCNIPGLTLGVAQQSNYLRDIPIPGDKLSFDDFNLKFIIDEDMENYLEIQNWLRGLGYPESVAQYGEMLSKDKTYTDKISGFGGHSDATLIIYNSNLNPSLQVNFREMFPVSLSEIQFDASNTDATYATAQISLKYVMYNIVKL